jgi:hypothetical protein
LNAQEWAATAFLCLLASFLFAYTLAGLEPVRYDLGASKARCALVLEDYEINPLRPVFCNASECCQYVSLGGAAVGLEAGKSCLSIGCTTKK